MKCKNCKKQIPRAAVQQAAYDGDLCTTCVRAAKNRKVSNDLLTSFGGKGRRGFIQWLKLGQFLQPIKDADYAALHWHNDRLHVITSMIGGAEKFDKLLDLFATSVLMLAEEEAEAND